MDMENFESAKKHLRIQKCPDKCVRGSTVSELSTKATLGTKESDHCREVGVVERVKQESMYGLYAKKSGR